MNKRDVVPYDSEYENFLEECKAIIVETVHASRTELLKGKWELGKKIAEEEELFNRKKIYGKGVVERIAKDLGRGTSDVWYCVQFFKRYPVNDFSTVMESLPDGKVISWHKVKTKYLPKDTEKRTHNMLYARFSVPPRETYIYGTYGSYLNNLDEEVTVKVYVKREE